MIEEKVTISKAEYDDLVERDRWLCALEAAGVDNWAGYSIATDIEREWIKEEEEENKYER